MGSDPGLRIKTSGVAQDESSKQALRSKTGGLTYRAPILATTKPCTPTATLSARMHLRCAMEMDQGGSGHLRIVFSRRRKGSHIMG